MARLKKLISGAGSIMDISPRRRSRRFERRIFSKRNRSDSEALRKDWIRVGGDIRVAMKKADGLADGKKKEQTK